MLMPGKPGRGVLLATADCPSDCQDRSRGSKAKARQKSKAKTRQRQGKNKAKAIKARDCRRKLLLSQHNTIKHNNVNSAEREATMPVAI